ncbi:potassium channel subfamily K member 16-like [Acanthaster planci]|uniref:Potassium channel subfamily K member 16-like n=1 Tax=Acanthaster planci TaxID=133434 RepID=A0A8B7YN52_ACAPL|nr:potassium channel subfamily K member 16-like [Acanthaster planci]XP_022092897.1 potassium channel subfamily K member 16-like [Acanthaster planci]
MFRAQLDTTASIRSTSSVAALTGFSRRHQGASVKRLVLLLVVYVIYIVTGALVFRYLEGGNEENLQDRIRDFVAEFLANNSCINSSELVTLVDELVHSIDNGLKPAVGDDTLDYYGHHLWDFPNSLFFATTVITTIGYGNMSPRTSEGMAFCVVFAFFGIPLTGWFLAVFGQCSERHWKSFTDKFDKTVAFLKFATAQKVAVYTSLALLLYLVIILLPSTVIHFVEGWSWGVAHYYTFISLSTIGFGDYVAGNGTNLHAVTRTLYKIGLVLYLILGLAVLTLTFKVTQHYQRKNASRMQSVTRGVARRVLSKRRNASFEKEKQDKENRVTVNLRTAKYGRCDSESGETFTISIDEFGRCLKDASTQTNTSSVESNVKTSIKKTGNSIIITSSQSGVLRRSLSWSDMQEGIVIDMGKSDSRRDHENGNVLLRNNLGYSGDGT